MVRLTVEQVEQAMQKLVEAVCHRLSEADDDDTQRLRRNWEALCDSPRRKPIFVPGQLPWAWTPMTRKHCPTN